MESLALLVAIIIMVAILSGPLAIFLTWLPAINRENTHPILIIIRRLFITLLSLLGSLFSFNLIIAGSTSAAFLMGAFGSLTSFFAIKREYFPNGLGNGKHFKNGKGLGNGFSRRGDRRNGPDGQQ